MTLADRYQEALLAAAGLQEENDKLRAEVVRLRAAIAPSVTNATDLQLALVSAGQPYPLNVLDVLEAIAKRLEGK